MRRYPPARPIARKPWSEHALNIAAMVLAVAIIIAVAPYVRLAVLELMQPAALPAPVPTAAVAPAPRPELVEGPAYRPAAPVYQAVPVVPTLAPGLVTEAQSEAIYQATAGAMLAAPAEGISEHGSKPSVKVWPTPAPAIEVQSAPVPSSFGQRAAPTAQPQHGTKPSQKRHP